MTGATKAKACLIILIFLLTFMYTDAVGRTIYVDDDGPADFNTIQAAIDDSNDGDTIIVQPGLYPESIQFHGKNITLTSTNPTNSNVVASTRIKSVWFLGTEDPNCILTGFKISERIGGGTNNTHATISHCLLIGNIVPKGTVIMNCDGKISNCIVANNGPNGHFFGPSIQACHGLIKNCTIANNFSGITVQEGSTLTIENSIIYGTGIIFDGEGTVNILYSNVDWINGDGTVNWEPEIMDVDPCFVDAANGDYHLKSQGGRWDVNEGRWMKDDVTSPCIDAGNPYSPIGLEPFPNGGRINMGAYGGTPEASKSYFGNPICETIVAGDINGDCKINFLDFQLLALQWLGGKRYIPNEPPVVSITEPPDGAVTYYGFIIEIEADASDDDGIVVKVEFFANGNKIGEDNDGSDGWKTYWQDHPIGVYNLTAKATDNNGAETTSTPIEITLTEGEPP